MKGFSLNSILIIIACFIFTDAQTQLQINTNVTPEQMVEEFVGVGINYYNVSYIGADIASGTFSNGSSAGLGVENGIFLTSGDGNLIPGPNSSYAASYSHGLEGHPLLTDILGIQTFDAAVLEFDFTTLHDTLRFNFLYGSEEYNEWVGAPFNDIYGLFVSGPNPDFGFYNNQNFGSILDLDITPADSTFIPADTTYILADTIIWPADTLIIPPDTLIIPADTTIILADTIYYPADTIIVPPDTVFTYLPVYIDNINNGPALPGEASAGPCQYCEYFYDNVDGGKNIEYDGLTLTMNSVIPVEPNSMYHFTVVIADASDGIFDSGVLMEGESFKSLGPAQFNNYGLLAEHNEGLSSDVVGQISGNEIYLVVPDSVDLSNLVASFEVGGVYVKVSDVLQVSGETANDFSGSVYYQLEGYNTKEYKVTVQHVSGIGPYRFNQVRIGPNPSNGEVVISEISGVNISIIDNVGKIVKFYQNPGKNSLVIDDLQPGIYFVKLEKNGYKDVRKLIIN
jgi:hypothetical protein